MRSFQFLAILLALATVVLSGTVFFKFVEGWSWIDAYFFTVVTLSTVGYGELVPATPLGRIGTTVFIFVGLGVFALAIQQFGHFTVKKREKHAEWLMKHLAHAPPPEDTKGDS
ncbi:potassium channel family protein [Roseovarius sp. 2305UL8-3]|uniref:potassium channel family protein n=1 Tax=Roseovarius conchicola TaxID=3121636 RepID=UPI003527E3C1